MFKPCAVIPVYNHGGPLPQVVTALRALQLPCILVDDASSERTAVVVQELAQQEQVYMLQHAENRGKGAAVISGLHEAQRLGFTHALQVDADGQHDLQQVGWFLLQAQAHPQAIICGYPQYDASVPKGRLYARYITHVWTWIHTLSLSIRDSMCGFRLYPLASVIPLISQVKLGQRMDFDTEILVRLHWRNIPMFWYPVAVVYPEGGLSNFRPWHDNWLISKMHTRLFFGMVWRLPRLLWRKVQA